MPITRVLTEKERKEIFHDNWPRRRRWLVISSIVLWVNAEITLAYGIWFSNTLGLQAFFALLTAIVSIVMFYVFGAIWDDNSKRRWMPNADFREHSRDEAPPSEEEDE